jgi:hypothetical protein
MTKFLEEGDPVIIIIADDDDLEFAGVFVSIDEDFITVKQGNEYVHVPKDTVRCIRQPVGSDTLAGS